MKKNELMYILLPDLSEEEIKNENEKLQKILADNGAKITGVNEWGLRDLAYEIKKLNKGYYVVTNFAADPIAVSEFNRIVPLDQKVVRFLITVANN